MTDRLFTLGSLGFFVVAAYRAVDFLQVLNRLFDKHLVGVAKCRFKRRYERISVLGFRNTDRRTQVDRLYDHWIFDCLLNAADYAFAVLVILLRSKALAVKHGDTVILEHGFHHIFIHTDRRRNNVTADIRNVEHF